MSFNEKYKKIKDIAKFEISEIEKKMVLSVKTREPLNSYIINFLMSPSKRIRPLLTILYLKMAGESLSDSQLELLTAIELVHNASLIHDDIIDESKFRRGQKTVSEKFDNKMGVITGDYLLSIAMEKIAKLNSIEILDKFSKTLKQMCQGEINQNFDRFKIGTIENYIEKSKNKTAYLFETALVSCIFLSSKKYDIQKVSEFGINVGIAFQIRDDLKNLSDIDTSKPTHNDIDEGIYNAPVIYSQNVEDYSSGIEKTKSLLNNYVQSAKEHIQIFEDSIYKTTLNEFLELLNNE